MKNISQNWMQFLSIFQKCKGDVRYKYAIIMITHLRYFQGLFDFENNVCLLAFSAQSLKAPLPFPPDSQR
jgi:hypothetical protein